MTTLVQIRTVRDQEEGDKGGYYNYEYGFVDDLINRDRGHVIAYVQGCHRYGIDDEDYYQDDESDNRPDTVEDYAEPRFWMYVKKTEIKTLATIEGKYEDTI
jgi:hypothetical protein